MSDCCNEEVYKNGFLIFVTHTMPASQVEEWVQAVAKESGQKVDWHYSGEYAQILFLGDQEKVAVAMMDLRPMHDKFFKEAMVNLNYSNEQIERLLDGIWSYNGFRKIK